MLESARKILENLTRPLAVMVSGGVDSMCLLCLAASVGKAVTAVHCNHRIRAEADSDEAFVRAAAERLGVPFRVYAADVPHLSRLRGVSVETAGRDFRRSIMAQLAEEGYTVCTAHHADDQAETVLLHLLRGSGIRGLCGMRAVDGLVVRPLIDCTRAEIEAYATAERIEYVTDLSNADEQYTRNFIRHRVLPVLNERFDAATVLNRLARHAQEADAFIAERLEAVVRAEADTVRVPLDAFADARAETYVRRAMTLLCAGDEVGTAAVDAVRSLAEKQTGKRVCLAGGVTAVREYGDVVFGKETQSATAPQPFAVDGFPAFGVRFFDCPNVVEPGVLRFDPDKLPPGAVVRLKNEGDRFRPFGAPEKSLKRYLVDKKIPVRVRSRLPVVAAGNTVYVVCGVEIGECVKIDGGTSRAAQCERI